MRYFSEDFIEQVRQASDLISIIGEDIPLKAQGDRYMGLCPFPDHNEKTPSFSVSLSKQVYHCFGCQKSGNIYTYLKEQRGMTFVDAVHYLARQARIDIPHQFDKKRGDSSVNFIQLNEKVCRFYQEKLFELPKSSQVWSYLKKRGYDQDIIKVFRLGYAPKGKTLKNYLKNSKEQQEALQLGLLSKGSDGDLYDNFRDRLVFPITSTRQQVIGFGTRSLGNSLPKYINSKESKIFHKGKCFYGLNESAKSLRQKGQLLVVEGYTDFLSLWQAGFKNIVATLGTALTEHHAKLLKRYVDSVIIIFDGDEAGQKAAQRSLPILLEQSLEVKTICLPNKQDPDDFLRESGKENLENLLKKSQDLFFQVLKRKSQELKSQGQSSVYLLEEMLPFLKATSKDALRVIYKQRTLDLFGSDKKAMERVLDKLLKEASKKGFSEKPRRSSEEVEKFSLSRALEAERLLLVLCLDSQSFLDLFSEKGGLDLLQTPQIITIFQKIEAMSRQESKEFDKILPNIMELGFSDNFLLLKDSYLILKGADQEEVEKVFQDSLAFLENKKRSKKIQQTISEMKTGENEDMKQLEKILQLSKEKLRQKDISQ
ncbi:MAG: DNA primase [Bdellovibrionales bacterium]